MPRRRSRTPSWPHRCATPMPDPLRRALPQVEDDIFKPEKIKIKNLKADQIDISYQPIIQSGGYIYALTPLQSESAAQGVQSQAHCRKLRGTASRPCRHVLDWCQVRLAELEG